MAYMVGLREKLLYEPLSQPMVSTSDQDNGRGHCVFGGFMCDTGVALIAGRQGADLISIGRRYKYE